MVQRKRTFHPRLLTAAFAAVLFVGGMAPDAHALGGVDVELGVGAYDGTASDSPVETGLALTGSVVVGLGSRWDVELGAIHAEVRNATSPVIGGPRPIEELQHYTLGFRFYPFSADRADAARFFIMAGGAYVDGFPPNDQAVAGSMDQDGGGGYAGIGFRWKVGEKWGLTFKAPFHSTDLSNSEDGVVIPTLSYFCSFE